MNYLHQTDQPLSPDLIWSRPETKRGAGKLLIIGGQAQEFKQVAESYAAAEETGAGTVRVLMPESVRKITKMLPNIEYASSNASGSFARSALNELLEASLWADGVLLAGDLGKNSETSLMLESFLSKYEGLLIINNEALPSLTLPVHDIFNRPQTIISLKFNELQKMSSGLSLDKPITSKLNNDEFAQLLQDITEKYPVHLIVEHEQNIWNSSNGQAALTKAKQPKTLTALTAQAAVWSIQQPSKVFEAIATAIYC